jgi:molybdopterin converting factor small subunit
LAKVQFTRHLRLHFPRLDDLDVPGKSVAEIVQRLDEIHPGLRGYLLDERGALRQHVNIFVNEEIIEDRAGLTDGVSDADRVFVMQALSGG